MASPTQDVNTAATVVLASSGFTALLKNYTLPELVVDDLETSHQTSAGGTDITKKWRTYTPGDFVEGGELAGEYYFNPDTIPPIGISQTVTVTFPAGATWIFTGYMNKYGGDAQELNGMMMISTSIKVAGAIEITSAS